MMQNEWINFKEQNNFFHYLLVFFLHFIDWMELDENLNSRDSFFVYIILIKIVQLYIDYVIANLLFEVFVAINDKLFE